MMSLDWLVYALGVAAVVFAYLDLNPILQIFAPIFKYFSCWSVHLFCFVCSSCL